MSKHLHVVGVGGIGVSAVARYYLAQGWRVTGTDASPSGLTDALAREGVGFSAGENPDAVTADTALVVYTEAVLRNGSDREHPELARARALGVRAIPYPVVLGEIANAKRLVAVAGSHGKSTTTAMIAVALRACGGGSAVVGTQVPQLDGKNCAFDPASDLMAIEACEYRRSFLQYRPEVAVLTNVDLDHLDYYRDEADYLSAFQQFADQTSGALVITGEDRLSEMVDPKGKTVVRVFADRCEVQKDTWGTGEGRNFADAVTAAVPDLRLKVPGEHLAQDARLAWAALTQCLGLDGVAVAAALESYAGSWRRSEIVKTTAHGNLLMSDYGHHPAEIAATLGAIKDKYADKKLVVCFQPHQYSRTRELLDGFKACFSAADVLIVPDIYFSRDSDADVAAMPVAKLLAALRERHPDVRGGQGLAAAAAELRALDAQFPGGAVLLLLGAGSVDDLRTDIA